MVAVEIPMPACVRSIMRPPEDLTPSRWSDRHRYLSDRFSRDQGFWRTSFTPYLREPMDATADPDVSVIGLIKASRVGGTELVNNIIGNKADSDPLPIMYVQPTREDVEDELTGRIQAMFEDSPRLSELIPKHVRNWATRHKVSLTTLDIYGAWPTNPQTMVRKTIGMVIFDEVDNAEAQVGYLGNSLTLLRERVATYEQRALVLVTGTPTYAHAAGWKLFETSDQRRYNVPCPFCGTFFVIALRLIKLMPMKVGAFLAERVGVDPPATADEAADLIAEHNFTPTADQVDRHELAGCECPHCKRMIDHAEHQRWMIDRGVWIPKGLKAATRLPVRSKKKDDVRLVEVESLAVRPDGGEQVGPEWVKDPDELEAFRRLDSGSVRVRGYHLPAFYSPFSSRTWSKILAQFWRVKNHPDDLRVFMNAWLAEPWREVHNALTEAELSHKRDDWDGVYEPGVVPDRCKVLLCGVDVQLDGSWYRVRGFGPNGESWGIDEKFIAAVGDEKDFKSDLEQAFQFAFRVGYRFADGRRIRCRALAIDSGAAARYDEVKALAKRPGVVMTKGMNNLQWSWKRERASPYRMSDNVSDLMLVNVDHYKGKLHRLIRLAEDHAQAYHFHRKTPDWVFQHICNEQQAIRRHKTGKRKGRTVLVWEVRYDGAPNHILDTEVYILAIADHLALSLLTSETQVIGLMDPPPKPKTKKPKPPPSGGFGSSI